MLDIILAVICILAVFFLWVMLYDGNRFVLRTHSIEDVRIQGTYRAIVLADLHNKQFGKGNKLLLEAIEEQKPDGIWIVGDMLTARPGRKFEPAINLVAALAEKYPVYYANGNHEHRIKLYPETYGKMAEEYAEALNKTKVSLLVNQKKEAEGHNIFIYGAEIDKRYYKRFTIPQMEVAYLEQILGEVSKQSYNVLLAHNPDYFPTYAEWGADLVLSGHIHGGMVRIPGWKGMVSPNIRFFPKYDGGKFVEGDSTMILSRGLGMHTIPVRVFNPGELIVIDFKGTKEE